MSGGQRPAFCLMRITAITSPARVRHRLLTALQPRRTLDAQNTWNLYGDIAWFGVLNGIVTSFLSVFTIRLGGTDTQVGLLTALPALITILVSIPGSRIVEREKRPLSVMLISGTLHRAGYLAIGLLPFFVVTHQAWGVVILAGLLTVPQAIANVAFTTMFAQVVERAKRAHVVSVRNVLIGITSTTTALAAGKFLDWVDFPVNYQILFVIGFATSLLSILHLSRIRLPAPFPKVAVAPQGEKLGLRGFFSMLDTSPGYTRFALVSFVFQWGLYFTSPLYSIYWVKTLHASDGWVGLINMIGSGTTILFYPLWGRLTARRGNRIAMIVTTAGLAGYPILTAIFPSLEWMLFVSFWGGVFSSGQALAFFNGLLEVCPQEYRATRIAAYNSLANVAAFASPLISTALIGVFGIGAMLILGGAIRLVGSLLIWQMGVLENVPHIGKYARRPSRVQT